MTVSESELMRIASESARLSIGPINRVPSAALFFLQPENLSRFTFTRKGAKKIEGVDTIELEFKETQRPTLIMRRAGAPVPMEGSLWVAPADGRADAHAAEELRRRACDAGSGCPAAHRHPDAEHRRRLVRPISGIRSQSAGRATTDARYSDFKTFATGASIRR